MSDQETQLTPEPIQEVDLQQSVSGFASAQGFELMQRQAKCLSASTLVPKQFQGNLPDCIIALEMAQRLGASPFAVMQQLYIVHGKPSWSSQFIISAVNASGKFTPLQFRMEGEGETRSCVAHCIDKLTGERLESPEVSIKMAKAEGWSTKSGSKWKTMPDLMLRYRAATFFGRLYAPEILLGMQSKEEIIDVDTGKTSMKVASPAAESFMGIEPEKKPEPETTEDKEEDWTE